MNEDIPKLKIGGKVIIEGVGVFYLTDIRIDNPSPASYLPPLFRRDIPEYFLLPREQTTATLKFSQY